MVEEFELNAKLCFLDKTAFTSKEQHDLDPPVVYNTKMKRAIDALNENLPTFALVDEGIAAEEKLCLLIERGSFWGMGYLPKSYAIASTGELKNFLDPYADNDYIRNNIYSFAEANPEKKVLLNS